MPLRIILYPNNEISCHATTHRAVSQSPERADLEPVSAPSLLDIKCKLEQKYPGAIAPSKDSARPGYGAIPKGAVFGLRARRRLRRLAGVFDHIEGENLFITLTLPGSTEESFASLSAYSSEVVHRYKVWLCQQAKKFDVGPLKYLYVWEFQKRGALHLHMVVNCPSVEFCNAIRESYHARWFKLLGSLGRKVGVDLFCRDESTTHADNPRVWQSDCQVVTGFIGAYLGKYLSKGSQDQSNDGCNVFFPTRWWGASQGIRDLFSELTFSYNSDGDVPDLCNLVEGIKDEYSSGILRDYVYPLKFRSGLGRVLFVNPDIYFEVGYYLQTLNPICDSASSRGSPNGPVAAEIISRLMPVVKDKNWGGYDTLDSENRSIVSSILCGDDISGRDYRRLYRAVFGDIS